MAVQRRLGKGWQKIGAWDREAILSQLVKRSTHNLVNSVLNRKFFSVISVTVLRARNVSSDGLFSRLQTGKYTMAVIFAKAISPVCFSCVLSLGTTGSDFQAKIFQPV